MRCSKRIRVMYVVPDLGVGGAERHVTSLMPNLDRSKFDTAVVCIGNEGKLFGELAASGCSRGRTASHQAASNPHTVRPDA